MPDDVKIKVDSGGLIGNGLTKATELLQGFPLLARTASAALGGIATAAAGIAGAFAGAAAAVREFAAAQERVATLDAALGKIGQLTDENREKLQELAGELQRTTAIADDEWLGVLTRLVQFGARPESIGMDVEAVKNLAGIVGNVTTAAEMYSKALAGNFAAFSRYGIVVGEAGDKTERLKRLQEELANKGGGQLEARAESLNGRFANLKNQISDVTESIGQQIAKSFHLSEIIDFVAGGFEWWAAKLGDTVEQLDGIRNATTATAETTRDYAAELELVARLSERITKATEEETRAIRAKQRAQDEVANAKMAVDLAEVDEAVRSGRMTQVQGVRARASIRSTAAKASFQREQDADIAAIEANEQGLADLMKLRSGLVGQRSGLMANSPSASVSASRARLAGDAIRRLEVERKFLETQGGDPRIREEMLADIDAQLSIVRRIPKAQDSRQGEIAALDSSIASLDQQIAGRRTQVLGANTEIAQRMATRETIFGLNQRRSSIEAGGEIAAAAEASANGALDGIQRGTGRTAAAMQQALSSMQAGVQANVSIAEQFTRVAQDQERRLRQLEAQVRNSANR